VLYFDIEANGFLETVSKVHCLVIIENGKVSRYNSRGKGGGIEAGLRRMMESSGVGSVAHNGIKYDLAVLSKLYPWFKVDESKVVDTLVLSRLMFTNLFDTDPELIKRGKLPPKLIGKHSLEAWGFRVGEYKTEYTGGFEEWNQEMEDYCEQDVHTLVKVHQHFLKYEYSPKAVELEHQVALIVARQERRGFSFDLKGAVDLYAHLSKERIKIERELRDTFKPFYLKDGKEFTPKADSKKYGYVAGCPLSKVKLTEFNPGSRDHISGRLRILRGWRPTEFTNDGKPKVDDAVLGQLPYPEAKLLATYMMLNKRIGQIAEGDQAWLKLERNGALHGGVITNGAVTGRMTHAHPNLAQVPAVYSPYGSECRALFKPRPGMVLVGADASALELRCLAGYMAPFDGGEYIRVVVEGRKEDGTEIHTVNMKALEIESRDWAKTWFYAFIYGAGDEKLGTVVGSPPGQAARTAGKKSRDKFLANLPALGTLVKRVKRKVEPQIITWVNGQKRSEKNPAYVGYLKGLDGRQLHIRSSHAALNTLLQSAGAILMKQALVCLDSHLKETLTPGVDYEFVANVHDEWQIECLPQHAEFIGKACVSAMRKAGEIFDFACPITGEYCIGNSWKETH
jgi:DNA polymerase-1